MNANKSSGETFELLEKGVQIRKKSACCDSDVRKIPLAYICAKCRRTCEVKD